MPTRRIDYLLIGAGVASGRCVRTLREEGADGSIVVVGREVDPPYDRPVVTKGYLQGRESREGALLIPDDWWAENDVELLTRTSAMQLDLDARTTVLSDKQELEFGKALVATGAMVRRLTVAGAELDGIHYLRALGNADALRRDLAERERVVLIGGSYIACETAASLTELGKRCTLVMLESRTLERSFGAQVGGYFQNVLETHGIEVFGDDELERFEGGDADEGARVCRVVTKAGRVLDCDAVVVGIGAIPDVMLARKARLTLGELGGVRANSRLETATPGVFVAGDICEYDSVIHDRVMRIEHDEVALAQGRTAALNMLGNDRVHDVVPYFFSDLADWASLEYVGPAQSWDEEIVRGSLDEGAFSIWYLESGRLAAVLSVKRSDDLQHARRLIAAKADVSAFRAQLADISSDLDAIG